MAFAIIFTVSRCPLSLFRTMNPERSTKHVSACVSFDFDFDCFCFYSFTLCVCVCVSVYVRVLLHSLQLHFSIEANFHFRPNFHPAAGKRCAAKRLFRNSCREMSKMFLLFSPPLFLLSLSLSLSLSPRMGLHLNYICLHLCAKLT